MRGGIKVITSMQHDASQWCETKGREEEEKNFPQVVKGRGGCSGAHGPQQRSTRYPEAWRSLCDESCLI